MDQLIAIAFIALLVFFVVKVGSILWRIAGVLFLLFIILQGSSAPFIGLHFLKFSSILHCNRGLFLF